ncbi:Glycosyl hydrolases family 35 [Pedobacter steynii]|uniref:Glycosyl hydrolases family 35 n=1 Tax=Pedobacter steynii TaxID=430522 RepID=A0A1G9UV02_9SPHI|nr:beta-galactosidase [Pedobacter steynii]NQX40885.1 beta-galactosidase [Pedobacter steynii]SDM63627.1 Glycosyl hydrolases family 35 [Pedobacter steynii]
MRKNVFITLLLLFIAVDASMAESANSHLRSDTVKHFPYPNRIRYNGDCMTIEGKDVFIYSAAFHYFRCPQELWRDRFRKIKAAGFNTVETYIPWNWHEQTMPANINDVSKFDFRDLKAWLKMAHEEFGLYTITRPGPFLCAEWSGGGYPRWLAKFGPGTGGLWLRGADPEHIRWSIHWNDAVSKVLAPFQITRKKKGQKGIILFQIENEYDAHGTKDKELFLKALYRSAKKQGIEVPIFTCLTSQTRASKDAELGQVFDCDNYYVGLTDAASCARRMAGLRKRQPDAPGFVTELQGGWFSLVTQRLSEEHESDVRHFNAIGMMSLLGGATGINYYMFFGGTHFAGWGARGMTTTYDYNAAIRESGALGEKYYAAKAIGEFVNRYSSQLLHSRGGLCELKDAPKKLFGGIRIAADGTKFVFLHNSDPDQGMQGRVTLLPGNSSKPTEPMYNINQYGEKVLIKPTDVNTAGPAAVAPVTVDFNLSSLGAEVLVIPPGASPDQGVWWPKKTAQPVQPKSTAKSVRISTARSLEDPLSEAKWMPLPKEASLSDIGVNDFRYSLYRSEVQLNAADLAKENRLLFNMFTRDIVTAKVNGKIAKRLFPEKPDAQTWITRGAHSRIRPNEFDNRFDVTGLLKEGKNEIVVVYENLGHAHGYVPMEELAGIRAAGLSAVDTLLTHPLKWEVAADVAGVTKGFTAADFKSDQWKIVALDEQFEIPRKGNEVQPKGEQKGLFTWYRIEFSFPEGKEYSTTPWMAKLNASGNGYMWLNGHNIGRHWEAGPQREFYLPECWLNFGKQKKNVLVFGLRQTENGAVLRAAEIVPSN